MGNIRKLTIIGKIALAAIFLFSGVMKLQDLAAFHQSVESFKILPAWIIPVTVNTIPVLEILTSVLLFWNRTHQSATICITALCTGFVVFYTHAWMAGIEPTCGCFGTNPIFQANPPQGLLRAAIIGAIAIATLRGIRKKEEDT